MSLIRKGQAKMKPKWYFVLGSLAMLGGFVGLTILSVFLISVMFFSLKTHGPMGNIRYAQLLITFPWGAIIIAAVGIWLGILLLKRYEFSYKKNFSLIVIGFVLAVFLSGWLIHYTGLDSVWIRGGPAMKAFYHRYDAGRIVDRPF